jgi:hypothetical protein
MGATRTELDTRTCRSSPWSQSRYTVARHTPSRSATSRTVSNRPDAPVTGDTGAGPSSKLAAKSLGSWRTGWDGWTVPGEETRVVAMGCEPLVKSGRSSMFLGCKWSQVQILSPRPSKALEFRRFAGGLQGLHLSQVTARQRSGVTPGSQCACEASPQWAPATFCALRLTGCPGVAVWAARERSRRTVAVQPRGARERKAGAARTGTAARMAWGAELRRTPLLAC